jgi:hypothetical protein
MPWPVKNPIQPGDGDPRHGLYSSYKNHGCRCDLCRAANAENGLKRRTERSLAPDDPRHGKEATYLNYACRCDPCAAAHAERDRQRYLAKQAAS